MTRLLKGLARAVSIHGFAAALAMHSRPYTSEPGAIVVIAPHPDDETLGCGALIAFHLCRGDPVHVIFLTDGEASHDGHPLLTPAALGAQRRSEALAALGALGASDPAAIAEFLHLPDGTLDRLDAATKERVVSIIAARLRAAAPTAVLAPYALGGSTEHAAAFALTAEACARAGGAALLEYPVWAWWNPWRLRSRLARGADNLRLPLSPWLGAKRRALGCHRTQLEPVPPWGGPVLPTVIAQACCGSHEFFFRRRIQPAHRDFPLSGRNL